MSNYYFLCCKVAKGTAFAFASDKISNSQEEDRVSTFKNKIELPFDLKLKKYEIIKGVSKIEDDSSGCKYLWRDYQPNNLAWPIFSEKLMLIINERLTGKENIVWMKVLIKSNTEKRQYYIPRFEKKLDLLNKEKTIYGSSKSSIVCPVFLKEKVAAFSMFYTPQVFWQISPDITVNEDIKIAIEKAKLVGIGFEKAAVS